MAPCGPCESSDLGATRAGPARRSSGLRRQGARCRVRAAGHLPVHPARGTVPGPAQCRMIWPHCAQNGLGQGGDHAVRHPGHPADVPLSLQHQRGHGALIQGRLLEVLLLHLHQEAEEAAPAQGKTGIFLFTVDPEVGQKRRRRGQRECLLGFLRRPVFRDGRVQTPRRRGAGITRRLRPRGHPQPPAAGRRQTLGALGALQIVRRVAGHARRAGPGRAAAHALLPEPVRAERGGRAAGRAERGQRRLCQTVAGAHRLGVRPLAEQRRALGARRASRPAGARARQQAAPDVRRGGRLGRLRGLGRRGHLRDQVGAHLALRAARRLLHRRRRLPVQGAGAGGRLDLPRLGLLLLHHTHHHRLRRLRARPEAQRPRGRGHRHHVSLPALRHRAADDELQPGPGGGHQFRQERRKEARHHQGRRGRVR
ncbi:hypothetical protein FJT64_010330 [Amphibalanus amphitrite]|uniref:Uncharacterized protein n=1 Tax=Amphibalanus amphitrite TaxID=1232801 RepID=A0A6A4VJV1_AMPAM|nr:hypothetical protein FJT64_010330 [Amphibalanus amphitrite]